MKNALYEIGSWLGMTIIVVGALCGSTCIMLGGVVALGGALATIG